MANGAWSYDETVMAFLMYCKMEFGKIHHHNPLIIEFAGVLGRTPSAVSMKMGNLARFDSELRKRGIKGLRNGSKMEEKVWNDFRDNSTELVIYGEKMLTRLKEKSAHSFLECETPELSKDDNQLPIGLSSESVSRRRIGQGFFRSTILASYGHKCCITGINVPDFLIASHNKPWSVSDDCTEKTNPRNGLCLNAFHDKAFDHGFITIDLNYQVIVSNQIATIKTDETTRNWLYYYAGNKIRLPEKFLPDKSFIQYHNDVVFRG